VNAKPHWGRRLLQLGFLLFLLGLLTGFTLPLMANPRMGLSSHLEGVMNGLVLVALGLCWPRFRFGPKSAAAAFGLALYGTYANWLTTLLAGFWGAGAAMPIAGGGRTGTAVQEGLINFGLISLSAAMIAVAGLAIWGLRGTDAAEA